VGSRGGKEDSILPLSDFQGNNPIQSWPPSHYTLQVAFLVSCSIQKPCVASLRPSIEERDGHKFYNVSTKETEITSKWKCPNTMKEVTSN